MAVTTSLNVIKITANGDTVSARSLSLCGVKAVETAGAVAAVTISASSVVIWESKLAALGVDYNDVEIRGYDTLTIAITGAANVYLYSR